MRAVQRSTLCRSWRELSNEYLVAKIGFDTAENEPCKRLPAQTASKYQNQNPSGIFIFWPPFVLRYLACFRCLLFLTPAKISTEVRGRAEHEPPPQGAGHRQPAGAAQPGGRPARACHYGSNPEFERIFLSNSSHFSKTRP